MKPQTVIMLILYATMGLPIQNSLAETRYVEIDGREYYCNPMREHDDDHDNDDGNAASCATKAYRGPFNRAESRELCSGAYNDGPADCALAAYQGPFSRRESIDLCLGAHSSAPADCARMAYSGPFSRSETVQLCSGAYSTQPAECALEAYRGPYSRSEAVALCTGSHLSINPLQSLIAPTDDDKKLRIDKLIKEANLKAFKLNEYKK